MCSTCGSTTLVPLGQLGHLVWARCRACGTDTASEPESDAFQSREEDIEERRWLDSEARSDYLLSKEE